MQLGDASIMRRHRDAFRFRDVRVLGLKDENTMVAETRGQSVDEEDDVFFGFGRIFKPDGFGFETTAPHRLKPNKIEAKSWIERIGERIDAFTEQPRDDHWLPQW